MKEDDDVELKAPTPKSNKPYQSCSGRVILKCIFLILDGSRIQLC